MELDETLTLAGPEGTDLDLVLAGIGSRGAALVVDVVVQTALIFLFAALAGLFTSSSGQGTGVAIGAIGLFLVIFVYPVLMETFVGGRTLGKMALGLATVQSDGTPVTFVAAAIRNVVRLVDLLPGTYLVGLIAILGSKRNQRVGDMAAKTLVVRRGKVQQYSAAPTGSAPAPLAVEMPAEIATWDTSAITADEIAAVRAFLERRPSLDPMHRHQLADTLARNLVGKVAGIPLDGGPELLLERIAYARSFR